MRHRGKPETAVAIRANPKTITAAKVDHRPAVSNAKEIRRPSCGLWASSPKHVPAISGFGADIENASANSATVNREFWPCKMEVDVSGSATCRPNCHVK
jgi:hypothetical protein